MMIDPNHPASRRPVRLRAALAFGALAVLGACNLEVVTPQNVDVDKLDDPALVEAMLRGTEGDFALATAGPAGFGGLYMAGALMTDELVHGGRIAGLRQYSDGASINPNTGEVNEVWAHASQARYTAEELVERINRLLVQHADSADMVQTLRGRLATASLWAGFANRLMGDHFCSAVIDGGGLQPHTVFYDRAIPHFSRAIELLLAGVSEGGEDETLEGQLWAAYGGRAQAWLGLGDWENAVADSRRWTRNSTFAQRHANWAGRPREWNHIYRSILLANAETTVWGTPWASPVGRNVTTTATGATGDPRISYNVVTGTASDGRRPFWRQQKYTGNGSSVSVANWREMKLIEAEYRLRGGDRAGMLDMIDTVRREWNRGNSVQVTPVRPTAATDSAAWAILIRERALALWLEGRRLPDMRRWSSEPGSMAHTLLTLPDGPFTVVRRATGATAAADERLPVLAVSNAMCIPVSGHERQTNPNIP